ncbi:DoxX family membrane protein [Dyella choica]|uniref:DoxX family membrane protein n=1 Tax=Dyella choica TaxID=1927959 RepID=A0A3S0PM87_9GAMM|nr:DoxX family membrane protein [Dyella choica]RUL75400.1 DoxX family membrane protein [Dyella choica]
MRTADTGRVVFALAFLALGLLSLFSRDFASVWQPVPQDLPGRALLAMLSGALLTAGGAGLLLKRTVVPAALLMIAYTLLWLLVLHVPRVILAPMHEVTWGGCAEILMLVAACGVLYACTATPSDKPYFAALASADALRLARIAFALALPLIGLEHLVYAKETAEMVPGWLPFHMGWAYLTGIAHIAAGLAIALNVWPRLAATLEAWMMGGFTVLVWIPMVMNTPSQRFAWTGLMISAVLTAAGWIVAASYGELPWLSFSQPRNGKVGLAT